jgi:hypothetical protein
MILMKLRTTGNSIRLRLSQTDVRDFETNGSISETLQLGPSEKDTFGYRLIRSDTIRQAAVNFIANYLTVSIPAADTNDWLSTDKVGIEASQTVGAGRQLRIIIEKDFACLSARAGDDDIDSFPNPAASKTC